MLEIVAQVVRSAEEQIERYRQHESIEVGHPIGWAWAEAEWMRDMFPAWKRAMWYQAIWELENNGSLPEGSRITELLPYELPEVLPMKICPTAVKRPRSVRVWHPTQLLPQYSSQTQ